MNPDVHLGRINVRERIPLLHPLHLRRRSQHDGDTHPELRRDGTLEAGGDDRPGAGEDDVATLDVGGHVGVSECVKHVGEGRPS